MTTKPASPGASVQMVSAGLNAGLVAGLTFLVGETILTYWLGGSVFAPVRLQATLALGNGALSRTYPLLATALVGLAVNLTTSALFGLVAIAATTRAGHSARTLPRLLLAGVAYGALLWVTNDLVVASLLFPQFAANDLLWHGAVGHVVFFGLPLGGYLALTRQGPLPGL